MSFIPHRIALNLTFRFLTSFACKDYSILDLYSLFLILHFDVEFTFHAHIFSASQIALYLVCVYMPLPANDLILVSAFHFKYVEVRKNVKQQ